MGSIEEHHELDTLRRNELQKAKAGASDGDSRSANDPQGLILPMYGVRSNNTKASKPTKMAS